MASVLSSIVAVITTVIIVTTNDNNNADDNLDLNAMITPDHKVRSCNVNQTRRIRIAGPKWRLSMNCKKLDHRVPDDPLQP